MKEEGTVIVARLVVVVVVVVAPPLERGVRPETWLVVDGDNRGLEGGEWHFKKQVQHLHLL